MHDDRLEDSTSESNALGIVDGCSDGVHLQRGSDRWVCAAYTAKMGFNGAGLTIGWTNSILDRSFHSSNCSAAFVETESVVQDSKRIANTVPANPRRHVSDEDRFTFVRLMGIDGMTLRVRLNSRQLAVCEKCEQHIGYSFTDRTLLISALTHSSGASSRLASNERLEFLGDSILGMVVCEMLFHQYSELLEGELTRIKSVVVSRAMCTKMSNAMDLEQFLVLGKGMTNTPQVPESLLADVFESLVAAIYLDGGLDPARDFIRRNVGDLIDSVAVGKAGENFKSDLQHLAQRDYARTPTYFLVDESGPDHKKEFQVAAKIGDMVFEPAWGSSKKEAEQHAARLALESLNGD